MSLSFNLLNDFSVISLTRKTRVALDNASDYRLTGYIGGPMKLYETVSGVGLINEVNQHQARLVLGRVTVCRRVNYFGM